MSEARSTQDLRLRNLDAVLTAVSQHGLRTRNSIAEATGLHKSSIKSLVDELTELGMLQVHAPQGDGATGRPPVMIDLAPGGAAGLGLEVRADALVAHVSDLAARPRYLATRRAPHHLRRADAVLEDLAAMARDALAEIERQQLTLGGITIAVPGVIDAERGVAVEAAELRWSGVRVVEVFGAKLNRPDVEVTLESTCTLAALAELHDAGGAGFADCLYVAGDDTVAARLLVDGDILRSPSMGFPDAFGHLQVETDGPRCHCGRHGCLEARTRRTAVLTAAGLGDGIFADLEENARAGDVHTVAAIADCGRWLGIGLSTVVNLLAPPAIVLAGDFAALAPWLVASIEEELRVRVFGHTPAWPQVVVSQLGPDAAAHAAARTAMRRVDPPFRVV